MPEMCIVNLTEELIKKGLSPEAAQQLDVELRNKVPQNYSVSDDTKAQIIQQVVENAQYRAVAKKVEQINNIQRYVEHMNRASEYIDKGYRLDMFFASIFDGTVAAGTTGEGKGFTNFRRAKLSEYHDMLERSLAEAGGKESDGTPNYVYVDMLKNLENHYDAETDQQLWTELIEYQNFKNFGKGNPGVTGNKFAQVLAEAIYKQQEAARNAKIVRGMPDFRTENYGMHQKTFVDNITPDDGVLAQVHSVGYTLDGVRYKGREGEVALRQKYKEDWINEVLSLADQNKTLENARTAFYYNNLPKVKKIDTLLGKVEQLDPVLHNSIRQALDSYTDYRSTSIAELLFRQVGEDITSEKYRGMTPREIISAAQHTTRNKVRLLAEGMSNIAAAKDKRLLSYMFDDSLVSNPVRDMPTLLSAIYDSMVNPFNANNPFYNSGRNVLSSDSNMRILAFKDGASMAKYQMSRGHGSFIRSLYYNMENDARTVAYLNTFGSNAVQTIDRIYKGLEKYVTDLRKSGDEGAAKALYYTRELQKNRERVRNMLDYVDNKHQVRSNSTLVRILGGIMNVSRLQLGQAVIAAIGDVGHKMYTYSKYGFGRVKTPIGGVWDIIRQADTPLFRKMFGSKEGAYYFLGSAAEGHVTRLTPIGREEYSLASRSVYGKARAMFNQFNDAYMRWTLTAQADNASRGTIADAISTHVGMQADKEFSSLSRAAKKLLQLGGVGEKEWDVYRRTGLYKYEGGQSILPAVMERKITRKVVADYLGIPQEALSEVRFLRTKGELINNYDVAVNAFANRGVTTPGIESQAFLGGGAAPDSFWSMFRAMTTQYLSYPTKVMFDIHRELYVNHINGLHMQNAIDVGKLAALSLLFGYTSLSVRDLVNGRQPRDPANPATVLEALRFGGALGLYGELASEALQSTHVDSLMFHMGPTGKMLADTFDIGLSVVQGNFDVEKAVKLAYRQVPNLMFTKLLSDKAFRVTMVDLLNFEDPLDTRNEYYIEKFGTLEDRLKEMGIINE